MMWLLCCKNFFLQSDTFLHFNFVLFSVFWTLLATNFERHYVGEFFELHWTVFEDWDAEFLLEVESQGSFFKILIHICASLPLGWEPKKEYKNVFWNTEFLQTHGCYVSYLPFFCFLALFI
jgi:hypothetical protein